MERTIGKLFGVGVVCAALLSAPPVSAQCRPQRAPSCGECMEWLDLCGDWEFGVHALYFSPFACEFDYATQTANPLAPSGTVATVRCRLDWGFRLFAHYLTGCNFASASYQWFGNQSKRSVDGLGTVRNLSGIEAIRSIATVRIEYQNADFRFGKYVHQSCGCNFYLFGNARWIDLLLSHNTKAISTEFFCFNGNEKSTLEGGAIGVGSGAECDLWCNFGLFGDFNVLGVIAQHRTTHVFAPNSDASDPRDDTNVRYSSNTCISPEIDFKIGINYTYACDCISLVGELGYEVDYFWNAFAFPQGSIAGGQANPSRFVNRFRTCENAGFSGLFFGAHIFF